MNTTARPTRQLTTCACLLLASIPLHSQTLLSPTGGTLQANNLTIEYSLGEIAITTLTSNNHAFTQGLLQPIVKYTACDFIHLVPTAFTPNGDNLNDCFKVAKWPDLSRFNLTVYNRWGNAVFRTTNVDDCWTGTVNGKPEPMGTYVYLVTAETAKCGTVQGKGTVTLIR